MNPNHEPTPEFLEALEQRLSFESRRHEMFAEPVAPPRVRLHWSALALVVLFSATLGAGGVVAAEHLQSAARRELLELRAQIQLDGARVRCELLEVRAANVQMRVDEGLMSQSEALDAQELSREGSGKLQRLELDLAEIKSTGLEPRDELSAPLVGVRDFVSERLAIEHDLAAYAVDRSEERAEMVRILSGNGRATYSEGLFFKLARRERLAKLALLTERRSLRARFLSEEVPAAVVDLLGDRAEARSRLELARARLDGLQKGLEVEQARYEAGVATNAALNAAGAVLQEAESEIGIAEIEIRLIEEELPPEWRDG